MNGPASGADSSLPAAIASVTQRLPAGHVAVWAQVLRTITAGAAVAQPEAVAAQLINAKPGFALGGTRPAWSPPGVRPTRCLPARQWHSRWRALP
jgi:hypothetical protein